jgi:hypothetical protein
MPDLPLLVVPHPISSLSPEEVRARADSVVDVVISRLLRQEVQEDLKSLQKRESINSIINTEGLVLPDSMEAVSSTYFENGWTDGLPIFPPTKEAVDRMMATTKRDPSEVIGTIPPILGKATVEKIAINAVMAGCLPEYMPVLIAAVSAMCEEPVRLHTMQPTTHPVAPLLIVNGPIIKKLGMNGKSGAFGPGWRSNATIGRAIRLILINIGGAFPGKTDMSTQGQTSKYIFCIAENEEDNPWQPLHVERGFDASTSTVSVVGVEGPHNINDRAALVGVDLLSTIAGTMATLGNNTVKGMDGDAVLALGPEHARIIARSGFSKDDIRDFLYEKARVPRKAFHKRLIEERFHNLPEDAMIPTTVLKENLIIIVVGGVGKHSSFLAGLESRMVIKEIK